MDKISVIVPVYNGEKYLEQCLDSLINQTYKDIEIILIDDGSTDKSGEICDRYAQNDSRIVVKHKQNGGVVAAVEDGINLASCEKVVFCDADDWVDSDYVEALVSVSDGVDMAVADIVRVSGNEKNITSGSVLAEGEYSIEQLKQHELSFVEGKKLINSSRCSKIYNTYIVKKGIAACNKSIKAGEDLQFTLNCLLASKNIYFTHKFAKYYYKDNPASVTNTYLKNSVEKSMLLADEVYERLQNEAWQGFDKQVKLMRIEALVIAIKNESRNPDKKLRNAELKKILKYYKNYNLKSVKYVSLSRRANLAYKVLKTRSLILLKVLVAFVGRGRK